MPNLQAGGLKHSSLTHSVAVESRPFGLGWERLECGTEWQRERPHDVFFFFAGTDRDFWVLFQPSVSPDCLGLCDALCGDEPMARSFVLSSVHPDRPVCTSRSLLRTVSRWRVCTGTDADPRDPRGGSARCAQCGAMVAKVFVVMPGVTVK